MSFDPKKHLISLKGKDYLPVAARLVWLNDEAKRYSIQTRIVQLEETFGIVEATVSILDETGQTIKTASAMKREDRQHFSDFLEKSETGAIGRALGMLGYGTQFAPEFDELLTPEPRMVDAPQTKTQPKPTQPMQAATKPDVKQISTQPAAEPTLESIRSQLKTASQLGAPTNKHKPNAETTAVLEKQTPQPLTRTIVTDNDLPEYDHEAVQDDDVFTETKMRRLYAIAEKLFNLKDDALEARLIEASSKIVKRNIMDMNALHWRDGNEVMRQLEEQAIKRGLWEASTN